jgi:hypothetical protein
VILQAYSFRCRLHFKAIISRNPDRLSSSHTNKTKFSLQLVLGPRLNQNTVLPAPCP